MQEPPALDELTEDTKRTRLQKMRRTASAVLVMLVLTYLATFFLDETPNWLRLIRHMAEAGMIGGLADWFAVVALFRHPLGIPIPHTALLPRNKARAAQSVGQFFKQHFLDPKQVAARVAEMKLARRAADWLKNPDNAALVAKPLTNAISVAMRADGNSFSLNEGLRHELRTAIASEKATSGLNSALLPALEKTIRGPLLNDLLSQLRVTLDDNRDRVLEMVQDNSRWWIASRVDRGVSNLLVDGVMNVIGELENPQSTIRKDFEGGLANLLNTLQESGALNRAVHKGKESFASSEAFDEAVDATITLIRERLNEGLNKSSVQAESVVSSAIQNFAEKLLSDEETLRRFEAQLATSAERAIVEIRAPIGNYVTSVIDGWEAEELTDRFELEIGPDLQFIRINGAILGMFIGGLLFFVALGLESL